MAASCPETLCQDLREAFEAEKKRGEKINWKEQSAESFARLDTAVRSAILRALEACGFEAFKRYVHFSKEHYVRNLIFSTEDFELMVLCWGKGQGSRIHSHGKSHGWVTVLQGRVEEARYTNPRAGLDDNAPTSSAEHPAPAPALPGVLAAATPCPEMVETQRAVAGPGAQLYINDDLALHAVRCADDTDFELGAVTLHLYAPPSGRVFLYEPENNLIVQRVPGFHSKRGVVVSSSAA